MTSEYLSLKKHTQLNHEIDPFCVQNTPRTHSIPGRVIHHMHCMYCTSDALVPMETTRQVECPVCGEGLKWHMNPSNMNENATKQPNMIS